MGEEDYNTEEKYIVKLYCPLCRTLLETMYDYRRMETTCKSCGLVLRAPPEYGIVYPEVIRIKIKLDDGGSQ